MAALKVDTKGTRVEALKRLADDARPILKHVGLHLVRATQRAFRDQKRVAPWDPRRVPNIPGALQDLSTSSSVKARRFQDRPALVDTGRLRSSMAYRFVTKTLIEFGTVVSYAGLHQRGGVSEISTTAAMRTNLGRWLKKHPEWEEDFGMFLSPIFAPGRAIRFRVRKRVFVAYLPSDRAVVEKLIGKFFRGEQRT